MAVTKDQAVQLSLTAQNQTISNAMVTVDTALTTTYVDNGTVSVTFDGINDEAVRDAIVAAYRAVGWVVTYTIDAANIAYLVFS